jgi:general secretion pathway protein J
MENRVDLLPDMRKTPEGFTLIEVVVTLTILGLILLIIFGAFRLGLSAWERGESTKEAYQRLRIISQLISEQVKSAVPYKIKSQKAEGDYLAFEGKVNSLKFVSALPMKAKGPGGFVYAIYQFMEGGNEGGRLVVYEQRALNRDLFAEDPKEDSGAPLLEGISNIRFEYCREEDSLNNRQEEWVEEWNTREENELPRAVRITITQKDPKEKKEIPITILAYLPANRFEEVRIGPTRRTVPRAVPRRSN